MPQRLIRYTAYTLVAIVLAGVLARICITDRFIVRGESMYPTLRDGQVVWANKLPLGCRIYTSFDFSQPKLKCFRLHGLGRIQHDDLVIFNDPDPFGDGHISFKINRVYIKRCIASPGDTLCIRDGYYLRNGLRTGSIPAQRALCETSDSTLAEKGVFLPAFPYLPGWSIKNMGPVYVPRKGDTVAIDSISAAIYARAIEYETGIPQAQIADSLTAYTFKHDYYFFGGDLVDNSRDSRYFGIVPDDFVIGKTHKKRTFHKSFRNGIRTALNTAADNRSNLEYVLDYYETDSLKRLAAEYLIAAMPYHYSYIESDSEDSIKATLASMAHLRKECDSKLKSYVKMPNMRIYDQQLISASLLISNIDRAFASWRKRPWSRYISFEQFCNFILPYRVGDERPEEWREIYEQRYAPLMDSLCKSSDIIVAVSTIQRCLKDTSFYYHDVCNLPSLGPKFLLNHRIGTCRESTDFALYLFRALGIPVTTDYSRIDGTHIWNMVLDSTGRYEMFWMDSWNGIVARRGGSDGLLKGKVYRRMFFPEQGSLFKDVTSSYFGHNSIKIKMDTPGEVQLAVFAYGQWHPFYRPAVHKKTVHIKNIEPGNTYILMRNENLVSYPFIPDSSGHVTYFHPDTIHRRVVQVKRKRRIPFWLIEHMQLSKMMRIEADIDPHFSSKTYDYYLPGTQSNYNWIYPDTSMRFVKLSASPGRPAQMAELRFFRDFDRQDTIHSTRIFMTDKPGWGRKAESIIDNDELTYFRSEAINGKIVVDLGQNEHVSVIEWVPRNDDNFIRFGDEYELMYLDGPSGWIGLGRQIARDTILIYDNAPSNAVFYLKNYTRGREEFSFIINQNGQQVFVSK